MATVMDCKALSESIIEELKERVTKLNAKGKSVGLATIVVGDDPASAIYVRNKEKACKEIGIFAETIHLPADVSQIKLEATIDQVMSDSKIDGAIVQLPLPKHLNETNALSRVNPEKDVDGFHVNNIGRLSKGQQQYLAPCTPKGIIRVLEEYQIPLEGKNAVVVGRSNIVGKPIAMMLLNKNCTVTVCHSKTKNLSEITSKADILVVAVGKPEFITADMVKSGAVVIDVGINRTDNGVVGDVDFDNVERVAGYITRVPGGIGKMTVTMLMENVVDNAEIYALYPL